MAKNPYFPFYVRDWLCSRRIKTMSGDAVKAYIYLLSQSWLEIPRATLPSEDVELAAICNLSLDAWMSIKNDVLQHFEIGKCKEHKGRFYQETLLEISRKSESKQRFSNKNAKRTQIKRKRNASAEYEYENEYENNSGKKGSVRGKKFVPPTLDEVKEYCKEKGYSKIAFKVFNYYSAADWKDSSGKPVLNWKQKLIAVWFKDENKDSGIDRVPLK